MDPFLLTADLETYMRRTLDATSADAAVAAACEVVRGYIGQVINLVEDDEVMIDGTGRQSILLPELPIVSIAEVTTFDVNGENETALVEDTDFKVGDAGVLWRISAPGAVGWWAWPWGHRNILVVYTHGYGVGAEASGSGSGTDGIEGVPSDIRLIALQVAARVYSTGPVSSGGMKSETIGKYAYTLSDQAASAALLNATEMRILDRYKQRRVA